MTWFVVFLLVVSVLIVSIFKATEFTKKRKQAEKDRVWNENLENLLQSFKRE